MKYQKITTLLDNTQNQLSKVDQKNDQNKWWFMVKV